jgi:hypothetical protein
VVFEFTSKSTHAEDRDVKFWLYEKLKVKEYFLFDPLCDYLDPPLRGYRLRQGKYVPIRPVQRRLPSRVLSLHIEQAGTTLRFYDPKSGTWLPTRSERLAQAEAENARLRAELDALRRESKRP